MPTRKRGESHIRNLQRSHGSYYVTLPIDLVRKLKWKEHQKVEVVAAGKDKVTIKDWKR